MAKAKEKEKVKKKSDAKTTDSSKSPTKKEVTVKELEALPDTIDIVIDKQPYVAAFKGFKTGSVGYSLSGKVMVNGLKCQISCNIIVIGSKPK